MGRKKSSIGCLFWTALVLLVLVVFLFNRSTIESVLEKTGLLTYLRREKPPGEEMTIERTNDAGEEAEDNTISVTVTEEEQEPPANSEEEQETAVQVTEREPQREVEATPPPERSVKLRRSRLYFVFVDESGGITLKQIVRPVYYSDSPLTDTLTSLLSGLSTDEIGNGLLSLVPEGSKILGISIKDGTAFIDFNESFRFNSFGGEGYKSQLQQIVYTATEFQTVQSVQFLINGNRLSYLGPESPFIGEPLSRESL